MRLSTRTHAVIDYLSGALLVGAPWAAGFGGTSAGWITTAFGVALIINALVANFELALVRLIQIPLHLWLDGIIGLLLALAPWLLSFDQTAWIPHLAVGVVVILVALLTNTVPEHDRRQSAARVAG